jgi:hypothetical protein
MKTIVTLLIISVSSILMARDLSLSGKVTDKPFMIKEDWTPQNTILELHFYEVCLLDFQQTIDIRRGGKWNMHPKVKYMYNLKGERSAVQESTKCVEGNPLLGETPSIAKFGTFGASCMILHSVIAYYLPANYRTVWQSITLIGEGYNVVINSMSGLRTSNFIFAYTMEF